MTDSQQTAGTRCTCTGGPYTHGPEGLRRAHQEIAELQQAGEGTDDD